MKVVKFNKIIFSLLTIFLIIFIFLHLNNVKKKLSDEDIYFINLFIDELNLLKKKPVFSNFSDEIFFINSVHTAIIKNINSSSGIPKNLSREPKDLYYSREGECYDTSRLLEKLFQYYGYKTKHISIYEKKGDIPLLNLLLKKGNDSHAISQIFTTKGWLAVDSVSDWISLDINNKIININKIKFNTNWQYNNPHHIFEKEYFLIYGLYSRHGRFYPPYNFIPDINFKDFFIYNLF
jgi:hypothetical protein